MPGELHKTVCSAGEPVLEMESLGRKVATRHRTEVVVAIAGNRLRQAEAYCLQCRYCVEPGSSFSRSAPVRRPQQSGDAVPARTMGPASGHSTAVDNIGRHCRDAVAAGAIHYGPQPCRS